MTIRLNKIKKSGNCYSGPMLFEKTNRLLFDSFGKRLYLCGIESNHILLFN